ncbi:hypothetical protein PHYBOEH_003560 [Phytophthora boehmeriae]|uniref:Uncharacterized protein n=1 Tax=Phytophthora boehmeriae TaxID=109152 RepID=A0A8T1XC54_9STRA|nr:hypothetical protein PHYBOEH_003560 [Phytophthora boehmeriae]
MRSWALLALLPVGVHGYRELNSSIDPVAGVHASFAPYAQGFVGYYGDPSTPAAERLNEGSPYSPDTPRIFFSAALQQTCPGMVGPSHNGEFYCHSRDYGYCDRRSGLCKAVPMIVHVEERAIMRLVFAPVMRLDEALTAQEEFVPSTNAVLAARVNFVCVARKDFMWNLPTRPACPVRDMIHGV